MWTEQTYGDFWRVCLRRARGPEMKEINAAAEARIAEAVEAERLRVEEEAESSYRGLDDSPIVAKGYVSETREATVDDVAALAVSNGR